jgi:hypothetical protein
MEDPPLDPKEPTEQGRDLDPSEKIIAKTEKEIVSETVKNSGTLDAKLVAASQAVKSADKAAESIVVSEAVRSAETLDAKVAAAGEAVSSANNGEQKKILKEAVDQASPEAREALRQMLLPGQKAIDRIWQTVVGAFAFVLCASTLALIGAVFMNTDQGLAQILLTVFTTVAGILAGFISGKTVGSANK